MAIQANINTEREKTSTNSAQYFTFILAEEEYGLDIRKVVEIRSLEHLTALPSAPSYVKGVVNLRGAIIPVISLRELFHMPDQAETRTTVIIVLQITVNEHKQVIGVIVDAASDVYSINPEDIKPKPEICDSTGKDFIVGLTAIHQENKQDKLIILLDETKLLNFNEFKADVEILEKNHENN